MSKVHHLLTIKKGNPIHLSDSLYILKHKPYFNRSETKAFNFSPLRFLAIIRLFSSNTKIVGNSINIVFLYHVSPAILSDQKDVTKSTRLS